LDTASASSFRHDARVIGLVGVAHALSHFFQLALPPLFPLLRAEFGVSWATLGTLMATFYVASGITQFSAGFVVDRIGARPVLLAGLALIAGGTASAGLAPEFGWLFPVVAVMGVGNGVFHPADFAILNASVAPRRLGPAYSAHGVGGTLGYALAPVASFALGTAFGWRGALSILGGIGLVVLALIATQRAALDCGHARRRHATADPAGALFRQPAILLCFAYFCIYTIATIGIQTFLPTALNVAFAVPLAVATSTLTAWLLGATAGIVAGGVLAARTARHDRVAAAGLFCGAALVLLLATSESARAAAVPVAALAGFALGATGPSRDMIVRAATPAGAAGRVYGFVYSGLDLGSMLGPILFGFLLDHDAARDVFYVAAGCFVAAIATVVRVRRATPPRPVPAPG
jgi:predicted MFS family arabinose efflux permease